MGRKVEVEEETERRASRVSTVAMRIRLPARGSTNPFLDP